MAVVETLPDGFYWGKLLVDVPGGGRGVVFVKGNIGYLFGLAFKLTAYDFGENPKPLKIPSWVATD